jgi:hypothetical protein
MMPDFLHIVPILNDTVFDRVLNAEHTTLLLSLLTNVDFLLIESDHDARHFRATHDG